MPGGGTISIAIGGTNSIPITASATVCNVTVTEPKSFGFVTAYDSGSLRPNASNLNYAKDQTIPNLVTVRLGTADGKVNLYNQSAATAQLVTDVFGYFL